MLQKLIQVKLPQIDLLKLKNAVKNSKITTIKKDPSGSKNITKNSEEAKKYYDYDDIEYEGIRDIKNLYNDIDDD